MFDFSALPKTVEILKPFSLYKWNKKYFKLQSGFFEEQFKLVREKQIEDFVFLNEFQHLYIVKDTDILQNLYSVDTPEQADLIIITDQKFSRLPCIAIIERIQQLLIECPKMYLCLNRHYINIDNSYHDATLHSKYTVAITQWLKKNLPDADVVDLSLDFEDYGRSFTWAVPDRHYFIRKHYGKTN